MGDDSRSRLFGVGRGPMALVVVGLVLVNLTMASVWSWRTFASSQGFADATTDMLKEPAVREAVADQIAGALEQQETTSRIAVAARPVVESLVADLVATEAFQGVFHAGVRELHSAIVQGRRSRLLVNVDDTAQLVRHGLAVASPELATALPDEVLNIAVGVSQSTPIDTTIRVSSLAGWLAIPFTVGALACFALAVRLARDRRRAFQMIGLGLVVTGVVHFALLSVGVNLASSLGDDVRERTALRAVFWSATHLINVQAKVAITIGTVLALAAAQAGTGQIRTRLATLRERVGSLLAMPAWRAAACLAAIAAGYFAMRWPEATASIVIRVVAFLTFVAGAIGLLDVLGSVDWGQSSGPPLQRPGRRLAIGVTAAIAISMAMLFGGLAFVKALQAPNVAHAAMADVGCNGHVELCDRRLDEVVLAGTHNSMAASSKGFGFARQQGGIGAQLASGVRAFLVDLHYGARVQDLVRTDFRSEAEKDMAQADLSADERAATESVLAVLGGVPPDAERTVYLCHLYCEFGATPAVDEFRRVHDFLRENPNEVVVLVLEDFVDPADAVAMLERSGLAGHAWSWRRGQPLPTLGEMIRQGDNVLILVENEGGAEPWYIPAYADMLQDTPYAFTEQRDFSCALGRGDGTNPLFMVNHWISVDPPSRAVAADANARDVLLARSEACESERGQLPNILAVDFFTDGDLFDVVDVLNGVAPP